VGRRRANSPTSLRVTLGASGFLLSLAVVAAYAAVALLGGFWSISRRDA
jgi:hypothetical protein